MDIIPVSRQSSTNTIIGNPYNANFFEVEITPFPKTIHVFPEKRISKSGVEYTAENRSLVPLDGYQEREIIPPDIINALYSQFKKRLTEKGFIFPSDYDEFFSPNYVNGYLLHRYSRYQFVYLHDKYYLVLDLRTRVCKEDCLCKKREHKSNMPAKVPTDIQLKALSFASYRASENKVSALQDVVKKLSEYAFPITIGTYTVKINPALLNLHTFTVEKVEDEPQLLWDSADETKVTPVVLDSGTNLHGGLMNYGAYKKPVNKEIKITILAPASTRQMFQGLIQRLNNGSSTFRGGMPSIFGCALNVVTYIESEERDYNAALQSFFQSEHKQNTELVLVYTSGSVDDTDDSLDASLLPYFIVKANCAKEGIITQMVDQATLANTQWKDLNLALGIFAKSGYVPWVLAPDENMENADIFIGISYSNLKNSSDKVIGYANVFDHYGKWLFFAGDADSVDFNKRQQLFQKLIKDVLYRYKEKHGTLPQKIQIHYSKRFSRDEMRVISNAICSLVQTPEIYFVSITDTHSVKVFDQNSPDKSFPRGKYWLIKDNEMYLSTTGYHEYDSLIVKKQGILGVPKLLHVKVWTYPNKQTVNMASIAFNILALTKLNWASTKSYCREPITTKFARNIAYLTASFKDIEWNHVVNSALRDKPWFL